MSASDALPELPEGVRLERLPPASRRVQYPPPVWAVWLGDARIGLIEQWKVPSASATFYRATATDPRTRKPIPLESNTDLRERIDKIVAAWQDPERFIHKSSWD